MERTLSHALFEGKKKELRLVKKPNQAKKQERLARAGPPHRRPTHNTHPRATYRARAPNQGGDGYAGTQHTEHKDRNQTPQPFGASLHTPARIIIMIESAQPQSFRARGAGRASARLVVPELIVRVAPLQNIPSSPPRRDPGADRRRAMSLARAYPNQCADSKCEIAGVGMRRHQSERPCRMTLPG